MFLPADERRGAPARAVQWRGSRFRNLSARLPAGHKLEPGDKAGAPNEHVRARKRNELN